MPSSSWLFCSIWGEFGSLAEILVTLISLSSGAGERAFTGLSYRDLARLEESSWSSWTPSPSRGGRAPTRPLSLGNFLFRTFCICFLYLCYCMKSSSIFFTEMEPSFYLAKSLLANAWFSRSILSFSRFLATTFSDLGPKVSLARFLGYTESHFPCEMSTRRFNRIWLCLLITMLRSTCTHKLHYKKIISKRKAFPKRCKRHRFLAREPTLVVKLVVLQFLHLLPLQLEFDCLGELFHILGARHFLDLQVM